MLKLLTAAWGISFFINLLFFVVAFLKQTDKVTDGTYSLTFITIAVYGYASSNRSFVHTLLFLMVCAWAVRLGVFLVYRIRKTGKDKRFDDKRASLVKFGGFWLIQAVTVWIMMIGPIVLFSSDKVNINKPLVVGLLVWFIGLVIESVSDLQKLRFSSGKFKKQEWIENGLWKYSRHPNYFGEITHWVGVGICVASQVSHGLIWVSAISPMYISLLLIFVSGVPLLEKSATEKWGNNKEYLSYKRRTSLLFPLPNKK